MKSLINVLLYLTDMTVLLFVISFIVCVFVLNHTAGGSLNWRTPMEKLIRSTPDITSLLCYHFWEPMYLWLDDSDFPSHSLSTERSGYFVGIVENVGHE